MIIDCFPFFNEYDMLEARLEYLWDYVDIFIILEADHTYSGKIKPLNYLQNKERFIKYQKKIIYLPVIIDVKMFNLAPQNILQGETDFSQGQWDIERYQRDQIKNILKTFNDNDIIIWSDIDEIPDRNKIHEAVQILENNNMVTLLMLMFYYNFKKRHEYLWAAPFMAKNSYILKEKSMWELRQQACFEETPKIYFGGWHLSYWGNVDQIQEKIKSFAHQEFNFDEFTNKKHIQEVINNNTDIFNRSHVKYIDFDIRNLPQDFYDIFKKTIVNK